MILNESESDSIWYDYRKLEFQGQVVNDASVIPAKVITEAKRRIETVSVKGCRITDLQRVVLPIAVEYKVPHHEAWQRIQGWKRT